MIVTERNIFTMPGDYHVVPVNCVPGVMGAGLARQFARAFPGLDTLHALACRGGDLAIGRVCVIQAVRCRPNGKIDDPVENIVLFPTKRHWRDPSEMGWIREGLASLSEWLLLNTQMPPPDSIGAATTVVMPALGCGLGGLAFEHVEAAIMDWEAKCLPEDIHLILCKPTRHR